MLNILRTFQLGFHRFFSLYLCSAWNRRDRDANTAPTAQKAPNTRESYSRSATLPPAAPRAKALHMGRGKRWNQGDARAVVPGQTLPQKPKWRHTSALYTETRAGTFLSSSITGSELY